jgi:hypothetical protein
VQIRPLGLTTDEQGACPAGALCVPPASAPIFPGTTVVYFSEMVGGSPLAMPDPAALTAVQWLPTASTAADASVCTASFSISDVAFVAEIGDARPPPDAGSPDAAAPPRCPAGLPGGCTSEGSICALAPPIATVCPHYQRCVAGMWAPEPCGP